MNTNRGINPAINTGKIDQSKPVAAIVATTEISGDTAHSSQVTLLGCALPCMVAIK